MSKKILLFLSIISLYCYATEEHPSQITRLEVPQALINLPDESKAACLEVLQKTAIIAGKFVNTVRGIIKEDSKAGVDRIEQSTEAISIIISKHVQKTINDVINIAVLKTVFALAVYHAYLSWENGNSNALFYMIFGVIGLLYTQKMLDTFESFSNSALEYVQIHFTIEDIRKLYRNLKRQKTFRQILAEEEAARQANLVAISRDQDGHVTFRQMLALEDDSITSPLVVSHDIPAAPSAAEDDRIDEEAELAATNASSAASLAQPSLDDILNSALDDLDSQAANPAPPGERRADYDSAL